MPLELIVGAAVGAAAASPGARSYVRKGMVYGVAGLLMCYDKIVGVTKGIVKGAREGFSEASQVAAGTATNGQAAPAASDAPPKAPAPVTRTAETTSSS
jgi:hypothetical protein